jgi:hypothetical protein
MDRTDWRRIRAGVLRPANGSAGRNHGHGALLQHSGPNLGRPHVDTLKDSKHANMKEVRFDASGGVWRVAFAFDPKRRAILLVAGDKSGGSQKRFYRELIRKADQRFDAHLGRIKKERK